MDQEERVTALIDAYALLVNVRSDVIIYERGSLTNEQRSKLREALILMENVIDSMMKQ